MCNKDQKLFETAHSANLDVQQNHAITLHFLQKRPLDPFVDEDSEKLARESCEGRTSSSAISL
jgi:hypothetical protein